MRRFHIPRRNMRSSGRSRGGDLTGMVTYCPAVRLRVWRNAPDGSKYANPTDVVQIAKIERLMKMLIRLWSRSRFAIN